MKNLIIVIHILLTVSLVGCADKGVSVVEGKELDLFCSCKKGGWECFEDGDEQNDQMYLWQIKNGRPNGQGTIIHPDGEKYQGEWVNGVQHGHGTYYFSDGGNNEGEWNNGKRHGQGTEVFSNGAKYVGERRNGVEQNRT